MHDLLKSLAYRLSCTTVVESCREHKLITTLLQTRVAVLLLQIRVMSLMLLQVVLVSAGFDAAEGDPLGGCRLTPHGYGKMTVRDVAHSTLAIGLLGAAHERALPVHICEHPSSAMHLQCTGIKLGIRKRFASISARKLSPARVLHRSKRWRR